MFLHRRAGLPQQYMMACVAFLAVWCCLLSYPTEAQMAADAEGAVDAAPRYPESIYPADVRVLRRLSEVPFVETEATGAFGYDVPFPDGPRAAFAVEDYGGKADGVTDCTAAFYEALAAAKASGGAAEIVFAEPGRYWFRSTAELKAEDRAILIAEEAHDLVIRGQGPGTVLVMGDPALGGLLVGHSSTVQVRDLAIDYNPLPYTQGTIGEANAEEGWFTLTTDPGYPDPVALRAAIPGALGGYQMSRGALGDYLWPPIGVVMIEAVTALGDGVTRLSASPDAVRGLSPGGRFIYVGRRLAQMALGFEHTAGAYVKDVSVHASPTCGFGLGNTDGVNIDGYAVTAPAGSDRLLSSNADGIYCNGSRGGITIRNSYFMGQGDDCINLHCPALTPRSVTVASDTEFTVPWELDIRAGDTIEVMDPVGTVNKGRLAVSAAGPTDDGEGTRVTLEGGLATVGYDAEADYLYPVDLCGGDFKIVSNYFGQNRSRCLLIQARHGLIEANTFENAEGYGIVMGYGSTAWPEGVIPEDVSIRRNVFRNVTNVGLAAPIEGFGGETRNLKSITIQGNRFINARKVSVSISGADGLLIEGNAIVSEAGRRNTWNGSEWYPIDAAVHLEGCAGVRIDGLSVRDPGLQDAVVCIGKGCAEGDAGVSLGAIEAETPPGVPLVRDDR